MEKDLCCEPPKDGINPQPPVCGPLDPVPAPGIYTQANNIVVVVQLTPDVCGCCYIQDWRLGFLDDGAPPGFTSHTGTGLLKDVLPMVTTATIGNGIVSVTYKYTTGPNGCTLTATVCSLDANYPVDFTGAVLFIDCFPGDGSNIITVPATPPSLITVPNCLTNVIPASP